MDSSYSNGDEIKPAFSQKLEVSKKIDLGSLKCLTSDPEIHDRRKSHKKKGMDELKHKLFNSPPESEISSSINHNNMTEISKTAYFRKVTYDSINEASQHLVQLCNKAIDAEDRTNRANQKKFYVDVSTERILEISLMRLSEAMMVNLVRSMLYNTITE